MRFRQNKMVVGKTLLLLVIIVGGLAATACIGIKRTPEGGSGVAIANGTLFVSPALKAAGGIGCAAAPTTNKLMAVSTLGVRQWEVPLETSEPAAGLFSCGAAGPTPVAIYGTPAVAGDLVYIGAYSGKIYAISSSSGALRWVFPREGKIQPIVGGLLVVGDMVYFGSAGGRVFALDTETGNEVWTFPTEDKVWGTPTIDGDTLYIGSFDKKLYALSVVDGRKKWEFKTDGAIVSAPLVYNNTVYIGSFDRRFYAVDATTGSLRWEFMSENWFWATPVVSNGTIYAGNLDGRVYALDAESGTKVAEFDLGSPVSSSPVLVDGLIIVVSEEGKVYSIENNQKREIKDLRAKVFAPLSTSGGIVYVHTDEQTLYALKGQTGAEQWRLSLSSK